MSILQEPCSCQPRKETFQWFVVEQLPDSVRRSFKNVLGTVGLKGGLAVHWQGFGLAMKEAGASMEDIQRPFVESHGKLWAV